MSLKKIRCFFSITCVLVGTKRENNWTSVWLLYIRGSFSVLYLTSMTIIYWMIECGETKLKWLQPYLADRNFLWSFLNLTCGVPQGSISRPLNTNMLPPALIRSTSKKIWPCICCWQQLYTSASLSDHVNFSFSPAYQRQTINHQTYVCWKSQSM